MIEALQFPIKFKNEVVWLTVGQATYDWLVKWFVGTPMRCVEEQSDD